jgi:hypothetical protein
MAAGKVSAFATAVKRDWRIPGIRFRNPLGATWYSRQHHRGSLNGTISVCSSDIVGIRDPRKQPSKLRHVNVMIPRKDFDLLRLLTQTDGDLTCTTKTAIILQGIKLVAKKLKKKGQKNDQTED